MKWQKVIDPKSKADSGPRFLEIRRGVRRTSYRVRYRQDGIELIETLGEFPKWQDAQKAADKLIYKARFGEKVTPKNLIRCEMLCNELIKIAESRSAATHQQTSIMFNKHLIPWLNNHCAYAENLNSTVWLNYRSFKRLENPNVTLKAHYEHFGKLCRYAREKGIIKERFRLDYDREKDDFKEEGYVITRIELSKMLTHSDSNWHDRIIIQRFTGMRPGEVRCLRKERVDFNSRIIRLQRSDTKTRRARPIPIESDVMIAILRRRKLASDSPYFFPNLLNPAKPMGNSLKGWHAMLKRAKVNSKYTPHDLRHTYATEQFKTTRNPALLCYQLGMSIEVAQKTYIHFTEEDARVVAKEAAAHLQYLEGAV